MYLLFSIMKNLWWLLIAGVVIYIIWWINRLFHINKMKYFTFVMTEENKTLRSKITEFFNALDSLLENIEDDKVIEVKEINKEFLTKYSILDKYNIIKMKLNEELKNELPKFRCQYNNKECKSLRTKLYILKMFKVVNEYYDESNWKIKL